MTSYDEQARTRFRGLADWLDEDEQDSSWDDGLDAAPELNLSSLQEAELASAVAAAVGERGCDNTLRAARSWAVGAGVDWASVEAGLHGRGGFCDCEVLLNVGLARSG